MSSQKDAGDRYVAHQLMIGNFRVALTLAARARGIGLTWRTVPQGLPIKPDGFFGLQFPDRPEGRNRAFFFLEADRSTMPRERFVRKLLGYWRWYEQGGHTEKLGIKAFRVLTVTKSEERVPSLLAAVTAARELAAGQRCFWFASEKRFLSRPPSSIFKCVWSTPEAPGRQRTMLPEGTLPENHLPH